MGSKHSKQQEQGQQQQHDNEIAKQHDQCLVMWLNSTLNEGFIAQYDSHTVKCLTLVSRSIANTLKNYIQQNYWFDLSSESGRRLTHYSPTNQKRVMGISEIMPSTKKVVFDYLFNSEVDNRLPSHITKIQFGMYFDKKIDHLPPTLTHLDCGTQFNKKVDSLPLSLTHLTLSYFFDQSVDHLPPNITHLILGFKFNQPLNNTNLPPNLTHLEVGFSFHHLITSLPITVKQVILGPNYNFPISHLSPHIQLIQKMLSPHIAFKPIANLRVFNTKEYQYKPPPQ